MKKVFKYVAYLMVGAVMTSCGGSGSDAKLFGEIPAIYVEFLDNEEALQEKAKTEAKSMDDLIRLNSEHEAMEAEYKVKIEEAAQAWVGSEIEFEPSEDFTVNAPLTVAAYNGFFSKSSMTARFDLAGEIVAAHDLFPKISEDMVAYYKKDPERRFKNVSEQVWIYGYDAEGNMVVDDLAGSVKLDFIGETVGVKAGTPVVFEEMVFSKEEARNYGNIATLKISFEVKK